MKLIPDALIQFKDKKIHASEVDANALGEIVKATGDYADMEFLDAKFLALTTRPGPGMVQAAEFLATSYDENEDEFLVGLVYVSERGVDFPGVPEYTNKDMRKAKAFYDDYENILDGGPSPQPVREAEAPVHGEDPRWFFTKEEIKGMLPGIEDRAVRWDPDTWSDETQDFAEDRGETVPELLDVLVSIQSMTINKAIETAIDYALDNEDEDYDYEGLDGELFGDGMTDGLSAIQTAALIYAAHFAYEGQVDDLNASREDTDEDELQESVARESPFYAALERVGDDDIKEYIEGRLERELTPEAYRKVVKVFSDATETESVYEALHFVGDDPIKEYVEKGLKRALGKKTFEIVETIFVESTTDDDDWGED